MLTDVIAVFDTFHKSIVEFKFEKRVFEVNQDNKISCQACGHSFTYKERLIQETIQLANTCLKLYQKIMADGENVGFSDVGSKMFEEKQSLEKEIEQVFDSLCDCTCDFDGKDCMSMDKFKLAVEQLQKKS
jgi:UDP-N-acetylmuramyl tripeptide synthase